MVEQEKKPREAEIRFGLVVPPPMSARKNHKVDMVEPRSLSYTCQLDCEALRQTSPVTVWDNTGGLTHF